MRSLFERLKYALYLAAVGGALIGLLVGLATADVIGLLPVAVFDMMFSPLYFVVLYVVVFIAAPWLRSGCRLLGAPLGQGAEHDA